MALASEILARHFEERKSCLPDLADNDLARSFIELDGEVGLLKLLRGLNSADAEVTARRNVILMFSENEELEIRTYRDATDALRALFELEKENPGP